MKVKITLVADIKGQVDSDMYCDIEERINSLDYVNSTEDILILPVIAKKRRSK